MSSEPALSPAFPPAQPYDQGFLQVSGLHTLSYTQSGNPEGKPLVFLHGGPGGSTSPTDTVYFDPAVYRIVMFDQRGTGKSTPHAEVKENTTWDLVDDIEKLRKHLSIDKWVVFGGSWGSTLSLAYAQTYPSVVKALILRGIFLVRKIELAWQCSEGVGMIFPAEWEAYNAFLPENERADLVNSYTARINSPDPTVHLPAARAWNLWEGSISKLKPDQGLKDRVHDDHWSLSHARLEAHYFHSGAWLREGQLIEKDSIDKIRHIPCTIVQGHYDVCCPPKSAYDLNKAWPESTLHWVWDAGHSAKEPGMLSRLVEAAKEYSSL